MFSRCIDADVVGAVPRQDGQPRVEQVVALVGDLGVVRGEGLETGADAPLERRGVAVVEDDGERVLPEVPALQGELRQAAPRSRTTAVALSSTSTSAGVALVSVT